MKAIIEFVSGGVGVLASIVSGAARLAGNAALASSAASVAAKAGHALGTVVAGIEIVYGVAVLLDPHATGMQKIEGAAHATSGAAYFLGQVAGFSGAAASLSILVSYKLFKEMLLLGGRAAVGLNTAFLKEAQGTMVNAAQGIVRLGDRLVKAGELAHQETDAIKSKALLEEEQDAARGLSGTIDNFLDDCNPKGAGHRRPGRGDGHRHPREDHVVLRQLAPHRARVDQEGSPPEGRREGVGERRAGAQAGRARRRPLTARARRQRGVDAVASRQGAVPLGGRPR